MTAPFPCEKLNAESPCYAGRSTYHGFIVEDPEPDQEAIHGERGRHWSGDGPAPDTHLLSRPRKTAGMSRGRRPVVPSGSVREILPTKPIGANQDAARKDAAVPASPPHTARHLMSP